MERICEQCGRLFTNCPSVPNQRVCGKECARERRRQKQKERMDSDPDYRENQQAAQKNWRKRNPEYMREYRRKHPGYVRQNRNQQRRRNKIRRKFVSPTSATESPLMIVKMTELKADPIYIPVPYRVTFQRGGMIVKMVEFIPHHLPVTEVHRTALESGP